MTNSRKQLRDRIFAWILSLLMIVGTIGSHGVTVKADVGDPVSVKVSITTNDGATLPQDAKIVFTAVDASKNKETPLGSGEVSVELEEGVEYSYSISATGYTAQEDKIIPVENAEISSELQVKNVTVTFVTLYNGSPLAGMTLSNNGTVIGTTDSNGKYAWTVKEGTSYSVTASGGIYADQNVSGSASDGEVYLNMEVKTHTVAVQIQTTVAGSPVNLTGAQVQFVSGAETVTATEGENGVYTAVVKEGVTYTVSASCAGFSVSSQNYPVPANDSSLTLSTDAIVPTISVTQPTLIYPEGSGNAIITSEKVNQSGWNYVWKAEGCIGIASDGQYKVNADVAENNNVWVELQYSGVTVASSEKSAIIVNKGSSTHPDFTPDKLEDTDAISVKFNVNNIPAGETGTLVIEATGGNIKGTVSKEISNVNTGSEINMEFTEENLNQSNVGTFVLQGKVTYTVEYKSNNYSYNPVRKTVKADYYVTKALESKLNYEDLIYGDDRGIKVESEGINEDSSLSYCFVDGEGTAVVQDILVIDSAGNVSVQNAGSNVNIKVTRAKDDTNFWAEASTVIPDVEVSKKEIHPILDVVYSQKNADVRYYNHSKEVEAFGMIPVQDSPENNEGRLEAADNGKLQISAILELPSDEADVYSANEDDIKIKSCELVSADGLSEEEAAKLLNNYELGSPEASIELGSFTIHPAKLTVSVLNEDDETRSPAVGVVNYQDLDNNALVRPSNLKIRVNGLVSESDSVQLEELTIKPLQGLRDVGEHSDVIVVDLENKVKPNNRSTSDNKKYNYEFASTGNDWATLKVEQENLGTDVDAIVNYSGTNVYTQEQEGNDIAWVQETNGKLIVNINPVYQNRYDAVVYNNTNLHDAGITSTDLALLSELKVTLAKQDGAGGFKNHSTEISIPFKLDSAPPVTAFQSGVVETVTATDELLKAISFGTFSKAVYTAEFSVTDKAADTENAEAGSDVKQVEAYVWKLNDSDINEDGQVSREAIENKIADISDWNASVVSTGDHSYSVEVAKDSTGISEVIVGSYIVLTKVTDNVNNVRVFASNGIVVEVTQPSVDVSFEGGKKPYYNGDVNYSIKVTEGTGLGVSGVSKVEWTVYCNGEKVAANSGSETLDKESENAAENQYTVHELNEVYTKALSVKAKDDNGNEICNSNNIELEVKAIDRSGNEITETRIPLIIDITSPSIQVAYDNNTAANGYYFKDVRKATVTFTERNFDPAAATFDLVLEKGGTYSNVSLDTIGSIDGISVEWLADSQSDKQEKEYTDARTNTAVITFSGDNAYSNFVPHCTDKAENADSGVSYPEGTVAATAFVVDKTYPVIDVKYYVDGAEISVGTTEAERIYKNKTIDAVITVTEHNFAVDSFVAGQVKYTVDTAKAGKDDIPDYQNQANNVGNWSMSSDIHQSNYTYEFDANYTTGFEYTDLAGNTTKWLGGNKQYFTVDKTDPTGVIEIVGRGTWKKFFDVVTFNLFSKTPLTIKMTKDDVTSPTYDIQYCRTYTALSDAEIRALDMWSTGDSYLVGANEQFVPYMKVTDYAGNVAYISSDTYVVVDDKAPLTKDTGKPIITITASEPAHGIYNANVPFNISVEDPVVGNTYSGLASVKYEILKDNVVTSTETYTYGAGTSRTRTMSDNKVVNAANNNSNDVKIRVTAADQAGNSAVEEKELKIDITKPTIEITFNNNSPLNGKYYKDTRTATVVVTERNFDESAFRFTITNTDGKQPSISGWSHSSNSGVSDAATHTCTVTFADDGDYTMSAVCTDLAGNTSDSVEVEPFTIDKTIPTISVSYDNNSAQNGNYYKAARTATITITEHNFRAGDVRVTTTASNGGAPGVSGWSTSGDRHTATVHFGSDADYTFDISYIDLAGNAAADYDQDRFTVDLTKPSLEITGVQNKSANKGTVAPIVKVSDTNFIASGVSLSLTGANKGKVNTSNMITTASAANGETITFLNFGSGMDDIYTLTAKAVDKAGNDITKSITFSVNRDGSTYVINDSTKKLIEKGFTNNPQDIVIQEINVDTLEFLELSYSKDGKIKKLEEGEEFKVDMEGAEGQWKKYTYTVFAKCFDEEGEYSINISSTDRAENINNNKVQAVNVDFVVDKTSPVMAVSNLENRKRYTENSHEFTLNVKDNTSLVSVAIYLDDELFKTYELVDGKLVNINDASDVLEMDNGKVYLTVDSKDRFQKVKIVSTDAAGNVSETEDYNVLVTANKWVQFYMNKPLFFGSIAVLVILIGGIFFIVMRRRKSK